MPDGTALEGSGPDILVVITPEFIGLCRDELGMASMLHLALRRNARVLIVPENLMSQKAIELILMRQLASSLAMPIFLVDPLGNLLFYNEPAERLLGRRYDETGEMSMKEWRTLFAPIAEDGSPVPGEVLPLSIALHKHRAAHLAFWLKGPDGVSKKIGATAFPLEGQGARLLGAVGIFWEES